MIKQKRVGSVCSGILGSVCSGIEGSVSSGQLGSVWTEFPEELRKNQSEEIEQNNINGSNNQFRLEASFWKKVNSTSDVQYYFRNGSPSVNEFLYREDGKLTLGKWFYSADKTEISIELFDKSRNYKINALTKNYLELKDLESNALIDFEKIA